MLPSFVTPYLVWFLLGFAFIVLELAVPGFILFFFGIGAWLVAIALVFLDFSLQWQLGLFIVCSLVALATLRRVALKTFHGQSGKKEDSGFCPEEKGHVVEVVEDILPDKPGQIKYRGSFWQAVSTSVLRKGEMAVLEKKAGESGIMYIVIPFRQGEKK